MPFVVMCGLPSSGKSRRTEELKTYLEQNEKCTVHIISDGEISLNKNELYSDPQKEKELRATLKSSVQRKISKGDVVILDSLNYIKGCRYELYCVTKAAQTPHCVIWCDLNLEVATEWNSGRPIKEQYTQEILEGLVMRFEPPDSRNRWDSPLFVIQADDVLPCEQIYDALYHRKAPPPNMSTQCQPLSSTNFLHELDKITQSTVSVLMDAQKTSVPGDTVTVPGSKEKLILSRVLSLAEIQRCRRQFISFTKSHPVDDTSKLATLFVQFLNNSIK